MDIQTSNEVPNLTESVLTKILAGVLPEQIGQICLQVVKIKKLPCDEGEKLQLLLSDGVLATPYAVFYDRNEATSFLLSQFCIVSLLSCEIKMVTGKKTIYVYDEGLEFLECFDKKIGKPKMIDVTG